MSVEQSWHAIAYLQRSPGKFSMYYSEGCFNTRNLLCRLYLQKLHVDFRPAFFIADFIHKLIDQKNSASMRSEKVLSDDGARNRLRIESFSRIANYDQ